MVHFCTCCSDFSFFAPDHASIASRRVTSPVCFSRRASRMSARTNSTSVRKRRPSCATDARSAATCSSSSSCSREGTHGARPTSTTRRCSAAIHRSAVASSGNQRSTAHPKALFPRRTRTPRRSPLGSRQRHQPPGVGVSLRRIPASRPLASFRIVTPEVTPELSKRRFSEVFFAGSNPPPTTIFRAAKRRATNGGPSEGDVGTACQARIRWKGSRRPVPGVVDESAVTFRGEASAPLTLSPVR